MFSSATSIQIQRGVGISTVGNGSFGGQIDISTMSQNKEAYETIEYSIGTYNSSKKSIGFGSGLINDKIILMEEFRKSKVTDILIELALIYNHITSPLN